VNEELLLKNAVIIEKLYMNKRPHVHADRLIELAVRNKLELTGIPRFARPRRPSSTS